MNLDQIAEMVEKNMNARLNKVKTVENIINEEVSVLEASMKRLEAEPLVKDVFKNIENRSKSFFFYNFYLIFY